VATVFKSWQEGDERTDAPAALALVDAVDASKCLGHLIEIGRE
jgi:hypothetical protein